MSPELHSIPPSGGEVPDLYNISHPLLREHGLIRLIHEVSSKARSASEQTPIRPNAQQPETSVLQIRPRIIQQGPVVLSYRDLWRPWITQLRLREKYAVKVITRAPRTLYPIFPAVLAKPLAFSGKDKKTAPSLPAVFPLPFPLTWR